MTDYSVVQKLAGKCQGVLKKVCSGMRNPGKIVKKVLGKKHLAVF